MSWENFNLKDEAPKLSGLQKRNVYRVPSDFFDEFEKDIRQKYPYSWKGRIKKLKKWLELSAAAAIIGLLLFSGIKIMLEKKYLPVQTDRTFYTITDGDAD